jgi:hypothetical protein
MEDGWLRDVIDWLRGSKVTLKPFNSAGWNFQYTDGQLRMTCLCGRSVAPTEAAGHRRECSGLPTQLRRRCATCAVTKLVDQFYRKSRDGGYQSACKACRSSRNQERYQAKKVA